MYCRTAMNTQYDWLCVFMSSDEGSGRASGGNGGGRDIIIDVLFEGGKARQSFDIRAVGRKWTDRRTSTKGFGVKSGDGLQFGVERFQKSVDVRFGERSMQRIETKMEFAVAWWSQRLASRMASKLVSPIDPRGSLRSLAAAVEKSRKRTSAVAWACCSAGVAAAERAPRSGYTGRGTTAPPLRAIIARRRRRRQGQGHRLGRGWRSRRAQRHRGIPPTARCFRGEGSRALGR
jgi:hypothetical protein